MSIYTFFVLQPYAFLAHNIHITDINNSEYNMKIKKDFVKELEAKKTTLLDIDQQLFKKDKSNHGMDRRTTDFCNYGY